MFLCGCATMHMDVSVSKCMGEGGCGCVGVWVCVDVGV